MSGAGLIGYVARGTQGPREHLRAQRFPDTYLVKGNKSEQTKGAGNAVASNVAHYLGVLVGQALGTGLERVA